MTLRLSIPWREARAPVLHGRRGGGGFKAVPAAVAGSSRRSGRRRPREEAGLKRANFGDSPGLPTLLLLPQLLILLFFFFIPSLRALMQSVLLSDPFGTNVQFVWFDNFKTLLASGDYRQSIAVTFWFTVAQNVLTLGSALVLAFATDRIVRGRSAYRTIILLPYAIAPAIAGILWAFLFNPAVGPLAQVLHGLGIAWDPNLNPTDALILVTLAASWKHICYDYIFLVVGLLAVPVSLMEAAAVDGAGPIRRFVSIALPMLGPTIFFLTVMNFIYGFFETFAIIDAVTKGGPAGATNILVYKVFVDGFVNLDLGSSAAQSVLLMSFALICTLLQFRYFDRKVNYGV
ncbi:MULTISPECIES: ABC transporter permease subunit [Bradyrhizobium]|jgi:sn-glycerol 3-phosphate transport system permease protein|uniref:sn-glycerol-3-phosphate transport system permease protein UgpA n=1 Tax=Bradyrhizobium ottawaense TaxID=931866 RepID=A0A2U8PGL3_9BRAD|nr:MULTISPECIES: ABC transporter permease subunit [Bradyrhizobium]AWL96922.1 glycerol-3-phosphate transporter permease [Bradyrhizobium ottawaense]MBR1289936.1 ABC transporter permease subunit [Bradyrhizobium ottawaense]MBR1325929.1 ABC transporter permease subunit [Bradyrhizobium ottawaense]MBR1331809.1 ABC transporter permease subunit [Bradyrhizobium ottawaense]PDT71599.1 glycerol-3-phosphate transporter permease [Bradyrhizobium ottawaense]